MKRHDRGKNRNDSGRKPPRSPRPRLAAKIQRFNGRRVIRFHGVKGKTTESVALYSAREHHAIEVSFADGTRLHFQLDPAFTVKTEYQSHEPGSLRDLRVLKSWPTMKSDT
jgi:hypothetical protein